MASFEAQCFPIAATCSGRFSHGGQIKVIDMRGACPRSGVTSLFSCGTELYGVSWWPRVHCFEPNVINFCEGCIYVHVLWRGTRLVIVFISLRRCSSHLVFFHSQRGVVYRYKRLYGYLQLNVAALTICTKTSIWFFCVCVWIMCNTYSSIIL